MGKTMTTYKDWVQFAQDYHVDLQKSHATDQFHDIRVQQESVPLIFVPGIMGSRLADDHNQPIWNPDTPFSLAIKYFFSDPAKMKQLLITTATHVYGGNDLIDKGVMPEDPDYFKTISYNLEFNTRGQEFWDWTPPQSMNLGSPTANRMQWATDTGRLLTRQGWGQIASAFYTNMLTSLSSPKMLGVIDAKTGVFDPAYRKIFQCPVYAFGYNWVHDNQEAGDLLAKYIPRVIAKEVSYGRLCKKVILISHSMGGLVTRSALHTLTGGTGVNEQVLGVIHGAQPVTGAPVCYRRIRAGFESAAGAVGYLVGHSSQDVLPVLASCVGGLELLPTKQYVDNYKRVEWLQEVDGLKVLSTAPGKDASGKAENDIYTAIYSYPGSERFLRMVIRQGELIPDKGNISATDPQPKAMRDLGRNVLLAEIFHNVLSKGGLYQYPMSFHMYAMGKATQHRIRWDYVKDSYLSQLEAIRQRTLRTNGLFTSGADAVPVQVLGSGIDLDPTYHPENDGAYFKVSDAEAASGDGTVPISSGSALCPGLGVHKAGDVEHGDFYQDSGVQQATAFFIRNLLDRHKNDRLAGRK